MHSRQSLRPAGRSRPRPTLLCLRLFCLLHTAGTTWKQQSRMQFTPASRLCCFQVVLGSSDLTLMSCREIKQIVWLRLQRQQSGASDLASSLPGHCSWLGGLGVTACCACRTCRDTDQMRKNLRVLSLWRGPGQPSPRLSSIPSFTQ